MDRKFFKNYWNVIAVVFVVMLAIGINTARADDPILYDECLTGSWYATERTGEGVSLEVLPDGNVIGYFYTYGSLNQAWYVLQNTSTDRFVMLRPIGLHQDAAEVGSATIDVIDNNTLIFSFRMSLDLDNENAIPWCLSGFCSGVYKYERITQPVECK